MKNTRLKWIRIVRQRLIKLGLICLVLALSVFEMSAQNMGVKSDHSLPDSSAMLDVQSTTQGFLMPRMTAAQKAAISSPANGLMIYQTDGSIGLYIYDLGATTWTHILDSTAIATLISAASGDDLGNHQLSQNLKTNDEWISNDGSNNGLFVSSTGFVGINDSTPEVQLSLNNTDSASIIRAQGTGGTFSYSGLQLYSDDATPKHWSVYHRKIASEMNGLLFQYYNGSQFLQPLFINSAGQIGIDNLSPSAPLDVVGLIKSDSITISNAFTLPTADGTNGQVMQTDGSGNVTWETVSGGTIDELIDADNDTKIQVEETADEDIIRFDIGGTEYFAFENGRISVVNSGNSTFLGDSAGLSDDLTNNENVFIGHAAGSSNTTGVQNTAIGNNAGKASTTGNSNVFVGYNSGANSNSGIANAFLGAESGITNTGNFNTFQGYGSGFYNGSGDGNVGLGYHSLLFQQGGDNNVAIGREAGRGPGGLHAKSGGIFIGYQAGYNETTDNKLYIENSNSSTPLIYGDFANDSLIFNGATRVNGNLVIPSGFVGINTATPLQDLDVRGNAIIGDGLTPTASNGTNQLNILVGTNADPATNGIKFHELTSGFGMSIGYDGTGSGVNNMINFYGAASDTLLSIKNGGNVGLGTTAAEAKLHISTDVLLGQIIDGSFEHGTWLSMGNSSAGGKYYQIISSGSANGEGPGKLLFTVGATHSSVQNVSMILDSNKLGIGIANPTANLDVLGTASVDELNINSAFTLPTADGTNGQVMQTDGSGNVTWEDAATVGLGDTTQIADADGDTRVLTDLAGADDDTIRFQSAGIEYFQFSGARIDVINSGNSVFIGNGAGENDDLTNNRNVVIGSQAGNSNISGSQITAVGFNALNQNSAGVNNTAIGAEAMAANSSGNHNVSIGVFSFSSNTAGHQNVSIGNYSFRDNTSGSENVVIGDNAGDGRNGSNNIFIGHDAGAYTGSNAMSGSIFIGNAAGSQETNSNRLYIDNSNTVTPLIYGDFANDSLKVYGNLSIGDEFSFPSADGTSGQVMKTDGAGNVTWSALDTFSIIQDADGNTSVDVEQSSNINAIRFTTNGTQAAEIDANQHMALGSAADGNTILYAVNPANTASTYGADKAAIYGYRGGVTGAANGGTGWAVDQVDAAVKGYSYWGNNYTAGLAGYSYGDFNNSTAVLGHMNGDVWAGLAFKDGEGIKWGVYTLNSAHLGLLRINNEFTLPTTDGTSGQVMQTDGSGSVTWQTPASGADGDWDTTATTLSTLKDVAIGGTTNYANSKLQLHGGGIVAWGTTGSLLDASGNNHGHDEDVALTVDGKSGEDILRLRHANTSNLVVVNNLGDIGIGTSTPEQELDVVGTTTVDTLNINDNFTLPSVDGTSGQVMVTDGTGNMSWGVAAGDNLGDHTATQNINLDGNYLSGDGDAEGIHVDANGDVTVGASYGYSKFAVWDSNDVDFDIRSITGKSEFEMGSYGTSSAGNTVNFYRARGEFLSSSGVNYFDRIVEFNSSIYNGSSTFSMPFLTVRAVGTSGNVPTQIEFSTVDGSGNSDERLVIQSNGNVAIGQSYSNYPLHISSSSTNTTFGITDADNGGNLSHSMYMNTDNNAIYQMKDSAANLNVYLNTGGTSWLKGGNVGIGKSSAAYPLDVEGETRIDGTFGLYNFAEWDHIKFSHTGSLAYMDVGGAADGLAFRTENTAVDYTPTYTEHMRILNSGNVGIGNSNPFTALDVLGEFRVRQDGAGLYTFGVVHGSIHGGATTWDFNVRDNGAQTTVMVLNNLGEVGIGTDDPNQALHVIGNIQASGSVFASSSTLTSDRRFKTDLVLLTNTLDKLDSINAFYHNWDTVNFPDKDFQNKTAIGVMAQDLIKVYPELVNIDEDGYYSVEYSKLTAVLLMAIKEQQAIILDQNAAIQNQDEKIKTLEASTTTQMEELLNRMKTLEEYNAILMQSNNAKALTPKE